ncbi:MAG: bifunctional adenosylcobinamide kinase/adenosylcobinamide-phosphate guanylyltransferase, partial [Chloroflexi bacterium]|nr:bifunctional adenosylcobinamide kinase/adenosylcobinamide-phosphate guanylyltransferase [Chloroflexota bacterium]
MAERVAQHRARRPSSWRTLEVQRDLAAAVAATSGNVRTVVVEDLTLALSNLMRDQTTEAAEQSLMHDVADLLGLQANVLLVSNEVGMGVVPPYALGRAFRDALGRVNQYAAAQAHEVYLLVAGLPLRLK